MKREIANYIEVLLAKGEPLTDAHARIVAYWEFIDFQCDVDDKPTPRCRAVMNRLLRECKK